MKNILSIIVFCLIIMVKSADAGYLDIGEQVDVLLLNYNFLSKLNVQRQCSTIVEKTFKSRERYANEVNQVYLQRYNLNFLGGGIGLGKYFSNNIMITLEGDINGHYISDDKFPKDKYFEIADQSNIVMMSVTTNIYYNFPSNEDGMNYYMSIGSGRNYMYVMLPYKPSLYGGDRVHVEPNFYIHSFLAQAKVGIQYPKVAFFRPYIEYKYIYSTVYGNDLDIKSKFYNLEMGLAIPT